MTATQKLTGRAASIPAGILIAMAVSSICTLMFSVIGAVLVSKEYMAQDRIGVWAIVTLVSASVAGGMIAANRIKRYRMQMAGLHGGVYYILLIGLNLLCFGGQLQGMGATLAFVLIGSLAAGLLSNQAAGKGSGRRRRKSHR